MTVISRIPRSRMLKWRLSLLLIAEKIILCFLADSEGIHFWTLLFGKFKIRRLKRLAYRVLCWKPSGYYPNQKTYPKTPAIIAWDFWFFLAEKVFWWLLFSWMCIWNANLLAFLGKTSLIFKGRLWMRTFKRFKLLFWSSKLVRTLFVDSV